MTFNMLCNMLCNMHCHMLCNMACFMALGLANLGLGFGPFVLDFGVGNNGLDFVSNLHVFRFRVDINAFGPI
jgi:hypothetical protein